MIARAGLCSRRDAEEWILAGRVSVNGKTLETPAMTITDKDEVLVDGAPLPARERTRLWLFHKPRGYVTTTHDPEGRATVFDRLPDDLPRVIAVGRLDINTEGLLLLTNDGGLARILELPATGWLRRYRVRAFGRITRAELDTLSEGIAIDGIFYGAIEASLDKEQGDNIWLTIGLREGKNREVKRVLEHLGLQVNRLIRLSFGPFQLADLEEGEVREIRGRVLRDQLGARLAEEAGVDFEAPILHERDKSAEKDESRSGPARSGSHGGSRGERSAGTWLSAREGQAAVASRKTRGAGASAEGRLPLRSAAAGGHRDAPEAGGRGQGRDAGRNGRREDRPQKISPRSRYRFTSDPKPKARPERKEFTPRPRRIWDDEGNLVEDKNQNARSSRDGGGKGGAGRGGPGKGGRPPKRGDRR